MNLAVGAQHVVEVHPVAATPAIDERDHVRPHVTLVVEHIATQPRIRREGGLEGAAQGLDWRVDLRA